MLRAEQDQLLVALQKEGGVFAQIGHEAHGHAALAAGEARHPHFTEQVHAGARRDPAGQLEPLAVQRVAAEQQAGLLAVGEQCGHFVDGLARNLQPLRRR